MTEKKRAPACAGTQTRAEKLTGAKIQSSQFSTDSRRPQGPIEALLSPGEENAILTKDLIELSGLGTARELRSQIERERLAGALILSTVRNGGGYYLPSEGERGQDELRAFIRTVRSRALNSLRILRAAKSALWEKDGIE